MTHELFLIPKKKEDFFLLDVVGVVFGCFWCSQFLGKGHAKTCSILAGLGPKKVLTDEEEKRRRRLAEAGGCFGKERQKGKRAKHRH